jgi:hypothetical protein
LYGLNESLQFVTGIHFVFYAAGATDADKRSLANELKSMSTMDPHPNIVNLIGAQTRRKYRLLL